MVWDTSPGITSATVLLRLVAAVIPVGQLWVGKLIIDQVVRAIQGRSGRLEPDLGLWWPMKSLWPS